MADQRSADLPDECWELIFNRLGHYRRFEPPSLACKRFLSITNLLRTSLTITDQTLPLLSTILRRFHQLKTINVREFYGDLDRLVYQIARSGLCIAGLDISHQKAIPARSLSEVGSSLKRMKCSRLCFLQDSDLHVIANSLPWLEELDISYPENDYTHMHEWGLLTPCKGAVTDAGIEMLSVKLRSLRKIDVSGNQFISDRSLIALSSNCALLCEIIVRDCCFVSQNGIGFVIRNSPNLMSVSVFGVEMIPNSPTSCVAIRDSIVHARALSCLDFSYSTISDEFLYSVAQARLPLKKLTISHCYNFTFSGISSILYAYQSLTHLALVNVDFLTDKCMIELCKFLHNLSFMSLNLCSKLTNLTFFTLTKNCPTLNQIEMERTKLGIEEFTADFAINPRVDSLKLARNMHLTDKCIRKIVSVCPNLQVLDVSYCTGITEQGVVEIFEGCNEIRHLSVKQCGGGMKNHLGMELEHCKLEVLRVEGSGINDDVVAMLAKRCPGLLHLDLEGCLNVTMRGVKEVLNNCRGLKEINLRRCDNVSVDSVAWMVFSRPSLRRIVLPCRYIPTESQINLFLRHGCLVCKG